MHLSGYSHRDLKPENILFDENFDLKLADFGFSKRIQGDNKDGLLHTKLGSPGYQAPEILYATEKGEYEYRGEQVDLFAAAIILFIMRAGRPPFQEATKEDDFYRHIYQGNLDVFWQQHEVDFPADYFTPSFKDLITQMLQFNPSHRPQMTEVIAH